jgi:hypothetical protein
VGRQEDRKEGGKAGRGRREGGKAGRREGGKAGRREGGKAGRREGRKVGSWKTAMWEGTY